MGVVTYMASRRRVGHGVGQVRSRCMVLSMRAAGRALCALRACALSPPHTACLPWRATEGGRVVPPHLGCVLARHGSPQGAQHAARAHRARQEPGAGLPGRSLAWICLYRASCCCWPWWLAMLDLSNTPPQAGSRLGPFAVRLPDGVGAITLTAGSSCAVGGPDSLAGHALA